MPTPKKGARLGGSPAHQRAILSNLATSLFEHGAITTTEAKARLLRPYAERLITKAKRGDLHNRRQVSSVIRDKSIVHALFTELGPRFADRPGGYTRITKLGPRKGDNAPMAVIELVEAEFTAKTRSSRTGGSATAGAAATAPADDTTVADTDATEAADVDTVDGDAPQTDAAGSDAADTEAPQVETAEESAEAIEDERAQEAVAGQAPAGDTVEPDPALESGTDAEADDPEPESGTDAEADDPAK